VSPAAWRHRTSSAKKRVLSEAAIANFLTTLLTTICQSSLVVAGRQRWLLIEYEVSSGASPALQNLHRGFESRTRLHFLNSVSCRGRAGS
jgi:hypothetical protein